MGNFLNAGTKRTQSIQTACVEICESRFDRVLFSVIDTPGLWDSVISFFKYSRGSLAPLSSDFNEGRELKLERQVSAVIKYLDTQYADTMSEVSVLNESYIVIPSNIHQGI